MKLFNRGGDAKAEAKPAPAGPAAVQAAPTIEALAAPAPAPAPETPDITAILDANVKEMSEKIAKLSHSLEGAESEKEEFEQKIQAMEDRMRKLSSLTEMISAQYNPFVGDAPQEREAFPEPSVGLASPPLPPAAAPAIKMPLPEAAPEEIALPTLSGLSLAPLEMEPPMEAEADDEYTHVPVQSMPAMEMAPSEQDDMRAEQPEGAHLWSVSTSFENSMLMLGWADMLLKNVPSRDSLIELVNYYHNVGWLGDPARDQLLAYADGIAAATENPDAPDWRASVEIHEKSLLFIEKLKAVGNRRTR